MLKVDYEALQIISMPRFGFDPIYQSAVGVHTHRIKIPFVTSAMHFSIVIK